MWDVEFTDQFEAWWDTLSPDEQQSIDAAVRLLEQRGPVSADRWQEFYERMIPLADELFEEHLAALESEGAP